MSLFAATESDVVVQCRHALFDEATQKIVDIFQWVDDMGIQATFQTSISLPCEDMMRCNVNYVWSIPNEHERLLFQMCWAS